LQYFLIRLDFSSFGHVTFLVTNEKQEVSTRFSVVLFYDKMSLEQTEDLKAFERRLTEVITQLHPVALKWRIFLLIVLAFTLGTAWNWLCDPETTSVSLLQSLLNHPLFTLSCLTMLILFLLGIHKRVIAPSIIASRCRYVLADYNMSCDDTGKLILKPRPTTM